MRSCLIALVLVAGCGGSSNTTGGPTNKSSCHAVVSGSASGDTTNCGLQWTEQSASGNAAITGDFTFPSGSNLDNAVFTFPASGDARAITLSSEYQGGIDYMQNPYTALHNSAGASFGSATLDVTGADFVADTGSGKLWDLHGTLTSTLVPLPGSGGTGALMLSVTF